MCIFKSQLIDKGTNKVTKEDVQENKSVQFDTTSSRYDLAIKEVEERVKLGWSVKASLRWGFFITFTPHTRNASKLCANGRVT